MAIREDREYRNFALPELRVCTPDEEHEEEKSFIVEGYATTFNDPYVLFKDGENEYKEVISPDAFKEANMTDVVFLYNHEGMVYARQKNGTLTLSCDEHGLKVRADLGSTHASREQYEAIRSGLVDSMSWAFSVDADEYDKKTHTRTITKVGKVFDVSSVCYPANPKTNISARNYFDGVIEAEKAERLRVERERLALKLKLNEVNSND